MGHRPQRAPTRPRHSAASLLLALNIHPRVVMELLGHSQISLTMHSTVEGRPPAVSMPAVSPPMRRAFLPSAPRYRTSRAEPAKVRKRRIDPSHQRAPGPAGQHQPRQRRAVSSHAPERLAPLQPGGRNPAMRSWATRIASTPRETSGTPAGGEPAGAGALSISRARVRDLQHPGADARAVRADEMPGWMVTVCDLSELRQVITGLATRTSGCIRWRQTAKRS
jgi:hypothetical protein